jgi:hypothetical protein
VNPPVGFEPVSDPQPDFGLFCEQRCPLEGPAGESLARTGNPTTRGRNR